MALWATHGYHTASIVLKRKKLADKFHWCSDRDAWLERVMVAHREGWITNEFGHLEPRVGEPVLVDALVWRFSVTSEYDAAVGGMIMSPREYVRCWCASAGRVQSKVSFGCDCMWCYKFRACVMVHERDKEIDPKFSEGVVMPPVEELGVPRGVKTKYRARPLPGRVEGTFPHLGGKPSPHEAEEVFKPDDTPKEPKTPISFTEAFKQGEPFTYTTTLTGTITTLGTIKFAPENPYLLSADSFMKAKWISLAEIPQPDVAATLVKAPKTKKKKVVKKAKKSAK